MKFSHYIKAVQSFSVAAHYLSFTHAGKVLNVTPGAVSRMVTKLENYLGRPLFERSPQGLKLTTTGAQLFKEVSSPLEQVSAAIERIRRPRQDNLVNLVCHPTFAARWLLPRWSRFYKRHPEIEMQITTTLTDVDFIEDQSADIVIQLSPSGAQGKSGVSVPTGLALKREHLLDIDVVPVCAPVLVEGKNQAEVIDCLKGAVLLHAEPMVNEWRSWLGNAASEVFDDDQKTVLNSISPDVGPTFPTLELALQAAIEGVGVALAFADLVAEDIASGRLVCPLPFERRTTRFFELISPLGRASNPAVRLYRDWLLEEAKGEGS